MKCSEPRTSSFPACCKIPADIWPDATGSAPGRQRELPRRPCQTAKLRFQPYNRWSSKNITEKCLQWHKRKGQRRARVTIASLDALMSSARKFPLGILAPASATINCGLRDFSFPTRNPSPSSCRDESREVQKPHTIRKAEAEGKKGEYLAVCRKIWRWHFYPQEYLLD